MFESIFASPRSSKRRGESPSSSKEEDLNPPSITEGHGRRDGRPSSHGGTNNPAVKERRRRVIAIPSASLQWWKTFNGGNDPPVSHINNSGSSSQSRILDIESAESASLISHAEKLCASQKVHSHDVLERLGFSVQQDTLPSPQPPASPRRSPESSLCGRRIRPFPEEDIRGRMPRTTQMFEEEDPFFEKKLHLGGQMAVFCGKVAELTGKSRSPSPASSPSSVDAQTPTELRAISKINRFTPTPPPAAIRRPSPLPMTTRHLSGADKDGCKIQTATTKMEKRIHHPSPAPPAVPKRTPEVAAKIPAPPSKAAPPNRGGDCRGTPAVAPKAPVPPASLNKRRPRHRTKLRTAKAFAGHDDLQSLLNPAERLSLCLKLLSCDDWKKKLDVLRTVRALARHHPALLQTNLHEVCLVLIKEVHNLRSVVACAAMDTIAELHVDLGRAMDPEAERTGRALLLKLATTTSASIHQQANLALDALVEGCSPPRVISALLNTGLSHLCVAVRGSTAQHLHQLADIMGEDQVLTAGKVFAERFLAAVSKMAVDAALEVRNHGREMLQALAHQKEFLVLWNKIVPPADRCHLQKILQKMRQ